MGSRIINRIDKIIFDYILSWNALIFIAFYIVCLWAWQVHPENIFYNDDGWISIWTAKFSADWGRPFDMSVFNPFQGMGSLFLHINPWLNPAALAFSLPLPAAEARFLTLSILWVELALTAFILFRTLGFSSLRATVAVQLLLLWTFPVFTTFLKKAAYLDAMAYTAHNMSIFNVLMTVFCLVGSYDVRRNLALAAVMVALSVFAFYAMGIFLPLYIPTYALIGMALIFFPFWRSAMLWKLGTVAAMVAVYFASGIFDYYLGLLEASQRAIFYSGYLPKPISEGWAAFSACGWHARLIGRDCLFEPFQVVNVLGLLGAALAVVRGPASVRALGFSTFAVYAWFVVYGVLARANILETEAQAAHVVFMYETGGLTMLTLMTAYCIFEIPTALIQSWRRTQLSMTITVAMPPWLKQAGRGAIAAGTVLLCAVIPFGAFEYLGARGDLYVRAVSKVLPIWYPPDFPTSITDELVREIGFPPKGGTFRGRVTTTFDKNGPVAREFRKAHGLPDDNRLSSGTYFWARVFLARKGFPHFFMGQHLWFFGIPTLDEYSQLVPPMFSGLAGELFMRGRGLQAVNYVFVVEANYRLLPMFGVRYVITDKAPEAAGLKLKQTLRGSGMSLFLYEIPNPNLGDYSPVTVRYAGTVKKTLDILTSNSFDPAAEVVLHAPLAKGAPLVPARASRMTMTPDGIHVTAESDGRSLLLLPLAFTHCWAVTGGGNDGTTAKVQLHRGNLAFTVLEFKKRADVTLDYSYGPFGHTQCRFQDAADHRRLGWEYFFLSR